MSLVSVVSEAPGKPRLWQLRGRKVVKEMPGLMLMEEKKSGLGRGANKS